MSFNKYRFENFKHFITIQSLAAKNGYKTPEEFTRFLETNYSHLKR